MAKTFRSRLILAMLGLGLAGIALTGWESSASSTTALRQATFDRLTAIRETKRRQVEDYFEQLRNHVTALAADESSVAAFLEFSAAWRDLRPGPGDLMRASDLARYYAREVAPRLGRPVDPWLPDDPRQRLLQQWFLSANPFPVGTKERLLLPEQSGRYGKAHARFHPTLQRYQSAFGFYDIFLLDAATHRVLYSVFKEIDLGADLSAAPHHSGGLSTVFTAARQLTAPGAVVVQDYGFYAPSYFAPAAFMAAPIAHAGVTIGVLAIQVSVDEVNRVMTGDRNWAREGLGQTGHAFIAGADGRLRSDMRFELEDEPAYLAELRQAGLDGETVDQIRRHRTGVLAMPVGAELTALTTAGHSGTALGTDFRGVPVLRSFSAIEIPGLAWVLVAEIASAEAFAQVGALQYRILALGLVTAAALAITAWWLGRSITAPVLALAEWTRPIGQGNFLGRVPVAGPEEVRQLAVSFNRMADDLERTTVSRDVLTRAHEDLQRLTDRLIRAQEDERRKLARDLHDDVTQRLASLAIEAGRLKRDHPASSLWRADIEHLQTALAQLSNDIHGLSRRLHPTVLDDLGLVAAIDAQGQSIADAGGPVTEVMVEGNEHSLSAEVRLALYRIVQEALQNARRHGQASRVWVVLRCDLESTEIIIRDNGCGFDRQAPAWRAGLGLASIEERARALGGGAAIDSTPGGGTTVKVTIPAQHDDSDASPRAARR